MNRSSITAYTFGRFRIDVRRRLLTDAGRTVALTAKAFDTLLCLVEHAGSVVSRTALMETVWPDVQVEVNNLNQCISALRRALGESPRSHAFIVTAPGRGYRFVAPVNVHLVRNSRRARAGTDAARERAAARRAATSSAPPRDPRAYQLYLAGVSTLMRPGSRSLDEALQRLEEAVAREPAFAQAYVSLAACYALVAINGLRALHDLFPRAKIALQHARLCDERPNPRCSHRARAPASRLEGSLRVAIRHRDDSFGA